MSASVDWTLNFTLSFYSHLLPLGKSFREEQCEKYNSPNYLDYNGNMKQWIPKYAGVSPRDRCKLFCRARGSSEFKVFESKVQFVYTYHSSYTAICVHTTVNMYSDALKCLQIHSQSEFCVYLYIYIYIYSEHNCTLTHTILFESLT